MSTPNTAAQATVKEYADRFLAVLERIAVALEGQLVPSYSRDPAPVSTPDADPPPDASVPSVVAQASISYDTVRAAIMRFQDQKGATAAQNVLKSFGAKYILDLKKSPEKYADVLAALQ
jgi:hypothetical protein